MFSLLLQYYALLAIYMVIKKKTMGEFFITAVILTFFVLFSNPVSSPMDIKNFRIFF